MSRKRLAPATHARSIPESVAHEDFLASITPLLNLIGVEPAEVLTTIVIAHNHIDFAFVVPADDGPLAGFGRVPEQNGLGQVFTVNYSVRIEVDDE